MPQGASATSSYGRCPSGASSVAGRSLGGAIRTTGTSATARGHSRDSRAYDGTSMVLEDATGSTSAWVSFVSDDFFEVLGVRPALPNRRVPARRQDRRRVCTSSRTATRSVMSALTA